MIKKIFKNNLWLIILIIVSFLPLLDLFHSGIPQTHDIDLHLARAAGFYNSLKEGNFIPRWAGNLNWGYGTPILSFVYPLPSYFISLFHFMNFNFMDSTKIVLGLSFILSGVFMYLWIKELWGKEAGFISGILYLFAPYRFVDLYVRGALGESVAFMFLPMVLYFLAKRNFSGISLSLAGLILSHNMLSLIFLPVIFGYMIYLIYVSPKRILFALYFPLSAFLGFALSAYFWLPAVFEAKYTLRDIVTKGAITGFENFSRLVWSSWSYGGSGEFSVQVGPVQWFVMLMAPLVIFIFWKKKQNIWFFLLWLMVLFIVSLFFMLPVSKEIYLNTPLLKNFQFAWRWLSLAIFPAAVFGAALIYLLPKKFKLFAVYCLLFGVLWLNKDYWKAKSFYFKPDVYYLGSYSGTTDTGEASPIWSIRFMEKQPEAHLEVVSGKARIKKLTRTSTRHEYQISADRQARLRENTLYFPGWEVLIDNQPSVVEFQDPLNRGLMTFNLPQGNHLVTVFFKETKLRLLADLISLTGVISLIFLFLLNWQKKLWRFQ